MSILVDFSNTLEPLSLFRMFSGSALVQAHVFHTAIDGQAVIIANSRDFPSDFIEITSNAVHDEDPTDIRIRFSTKSSST